MTTIRDIARLAGVSVATVSRVLNHYPDVSEETKQRVLQVAAQLDYRPSAAARALVTRRSNVIGVFYLHEHENNVVLHPFFQEVLVGLKRTVGRAGFDMLFFTSQAPGDESYTYVKRCLHHRVDGVVLLGVDRADPGVAELGSSGIPCVAVDVDILGPRTGYVISDNTGGARSAVAHLANLGHRRIALINGIANHRVGHDRFLGYCEALAQAGIPYRSEYVLDHDFTWEHGYNAARRLLDLPEPPTAIFAAADYTAIGAIKAIQERGLRVPGDVAVVGFDDIQMASMVHPALTTVRQDKEGLGREAGEALIRLIEEPDARPPVVTLPTELVVRESCGA